MKSDRLSCNFDCSEREIADAIDAVEFSGVKMRRSWSKSRNRVAILLDRSVWYSKNLRGKSVVLDIGKNGLVNGECTDLSLLNFSKSSNKMTLQKIFTSMSHHLNKPSKPVKVQQ